MKKNISSYVPFWHENFEFKKLVIDLARKQPPTFEGIHVAALIYVNAVDYIAQHLLEHLMNMTYLATNHEFNCVMFFDVVKPEHVSLGNTIRELNKYEFPDKKDFMEGLNEFVTIRNRLLHNLLTLSPEEVNKLNDDFQKIKDLGEGLLIKYDTITNGIKGAWVVYINKLSSVDKSAVNIAKEENKKTQEESKNKGEKSEKPKK